MIIESSAQVARHRMADLIMTYRLDEASRETVILDIVEMIAQRMTSTEDYAVHTVGVCVRGNLMAATRGIVSTTAVVGRLTAICLSAPVGHAYLARMLKIG